MDGNRLADEDLGNHPKAGNETFSKQEVSQDRDQLAKTPDNVFSFS